MAGPSHLYYPLIDTAGNVLTNTVVRLYEAGTNTPVLDAFFADPDLSEPVTNPFTTASGIVDVFFEAPQRLKVEMTPPLTDAPVAVDYIDTLDPFPIAVDIAYDDSATGYGHQDVQTAIQAFPSLFSQAYTLRSVKTSGYTAAPGDLVPVDTTSGAVTITLPSAPADRSRITVKHIIQGGTNTVSIVRGGVDVFNKVGGSTTMTLTLVNQALQVQYDATSQIWTVIADDLALSTLDSRYLRLVQLADSVSTSGATQTIADVTTATVHSVTLTADCTFTFPTAVAGKSFLLRLTQGSGGSHLAIWPGSVKWPSGTAPTLTTTAAAIDVVSFTCINGTDWYGTVVGLAFA